MKRICFIGASTTEGMGDETGAGWPGRLAQPYRETIIPYNLGVRGQLLAEIANRAASECCARILDRDLGGIIFCSGMNDIARHNGIRRNSSRRANETYTTLLRDLAGIARLIVVGPFPVFTARMPYHSQMSGLDFDFRNDDIAVADQAYQSIAEEMGIPYLSLFNELRQSDLYAGSLSQGDGLHPGGAGYQLIADKIGAWAPWQKLIT